MRVVIPVATLKQHRACRDAYISPEWNEAEQALIYENWDATVERCLATTGSDASRHVGVSWLTWLVRHKLVPMTKEALDKLLRDRGGV